jgi:hypothetical protein
MSKLLISEEPLQVLPALATVIGLNEALVLQQIHYWIEKSKIIVNNKKWVYNTFEEWHKQFPFWSLRTLKNVFKSLQNQELIVAEKLSKDKFNKTNYYTINYDLLTKIDEEIAAKKRKEIEEKSVDFLEENTSKFHENNSGFYDSAKVAQSTSKNEYIDSAKVAQSRQCKSFTPDSATFAQSYIVKSFDRDYLTETTTETTLSPLPSLTKKSQPEVDSDSTEKEERRERKFLNFVNQIRERYKPDSARDFFPTILEQAKINEKGEVGKLKIDNKGHLYIKYKYELQDLSANEADRVWRWMFDHQEKIVPIKNQKKETA